MNDVPSQLHEDFFSDDDFISPTPETNTFQPTNNVEPTNANFNWSDEIKRLSDVQSELNHDIASLREQMLISFEDVFKTIADLYKKVEEKVAQVHYTDNGHHQESDMFGQGRENLGHDDDEFTGGVVGGSNGPFGSPVYSGNVEIDENMGNQGVKIVSKNMKEDNTNIHDEGKDTTTDAVKSAQYFCSGDSTSAYIRKHPFEVDIGK
ncbi:hypothetical protein K7X08_020188 [Anisodus acutangulus]|uniref:Uncharacterized protein n=1 Tax=Anisodus acutangulus TaxID=402998 RepID=A0A9Q1M5Y9_9SOLA|nr:hypothetical protein K7X08_020188 [Anisodus acutangulus]